ncbi:MAG TPA: indole-3-glycerol phosphate synthase TrpC [Blastocatellia bacterium]|nr:indole-3-glycerol phosphate synthase TrpC [Blastocatellia bacterium]
MEKQVVQLPRGVIPTGGILEEIVRARVNRVEESKRARPLEAVAARPRIASAASEPRPFGEALSRGGRVNVIAEIKRRSPSKGVIREGFDHLSIARSYEQAGASAISVLTEEDFFEGSLSYLRDIGRELQTPLLRKDFVFDEYQVYEALEAGAAAILLIAALLDDGLLVRLLGLADEVGLDSLVEVHTEEEMRRAARSGARIIGVNNRNLSTFEVDMQTSLRLARLAPASAILVSESGINTGEDVRELMGAGFKGFLIGERLMRDADPGEGLRRIISEAENP